MAKIKGNYETYFRILRQLREVVLPNQENIKPVLRSLTKGASVALFVIAGVTLLISIVGSAYSQLSGNEVDFSSLIRASFALALSGFGASVTAQAGQLNLGLGAIDSVITVGAHSGLIFIVAFLIIRRIARNSSSTDEGSDTSPIHMAIGFAAFSWLTGFFAQGAFSYVVGSIEIRQLSLISTLAIFGFAWLAAYRGKISNNYQSASGFGQVTQWVSKTLTNFIVTYAILTLLAIIVAAITFAIEPIFAYASEPLQPAKMELPEGQIVLVFAATMLFLLNGIFQGLFAAMGLNIGLHIDQAAGGLFSLDNLGINSGKTSFWLLSDVGVAAFVGVLALVLLVALISGAAATSKTSLTFRSNQTYLQALGYGTLVAFGVTYAMNLQFSSETTAEVGTSANSVLASVTLGSTFVSVLVLSTVVLSLAFLASGKIFKFVASAFPTLSVRIPRGEIVEARTLSGRIFGIVAKLALLAVALTPITAATINRVWSYTDGPTQVGQKFADNLQKMKIADLKTYINPDSETRLKWLSDKVLDAAQPKDGYSTEVKVTNDLKKNWNPGNLDAKVQVTFNKEGKSFSYKFETDPTYSEPSWLLKHVDYKPVLSPGTLKVVASKYLPKSQLAKFTVNGQKSKIGAFYSIPGIYTVKAEGYKLIAPTEKTFYSSQYDSLRIGFDVGLPSGASGKLDAAILGKAQDCFRTSATGSSKCIKVGKLSSSIASGTKPEKYFNYSDSSYDTKETTCSSTRTDKLQSAISEESKASCKTTVTFTRTYFDSKPKQVPKYAYEDRCTGAMISDYWESSGEVLSYRDGWNGWDYYDSNDYVINESGRHYDDCYESYQVKVQDGFETIKVRGAKLSSTTMTANFEKVISVTGNLRKDGSFQITR